MTGKKVAVMILWGIGVALVTAGALYVKATYLDGGAFALDTQRIIEIIGSFVAGMIGGWAWQNKKGA